MKPKLFLVKRSDGLFSTADDVCSELSKKIPFGDLVEVKQCNQRLSWFHRRFWLALALIHNNLSEEMSEMYPTQESLRKAMLILSGHVDIVKLPDGTQQITPATMDYSLGQNEFEQVYNAFINVGFKYFVGVEIQQQILDLT